MIPIILLTQSKSKTQYQEQEVRSVSLIVYNVVFQLTHTYNVHNIVGPLVPYNHARPKQGLIRQGRESSAIRPLLYL